MWVKIEFKEYRDEDELIFVPRTIYTQVKALNLGKECSDYLEIYCEVTEVLSESLVLGSFILHTVYSTPKVCAVTGTWENDPFHGDYPCVQGFELLSETEVLSCIKPSKTLTDSKPACTGCGSGSTVKAGKVAKNGLKIQQWRCNDCGRRFTN